MNNAIGSDKGKRTVEYVCQFHSTPSFARRRFTGSLGSSSGSSNSGTDGSDMRNCARSFTSLPMGTNGTERPSAHLLNSEVV